VTTLMQTIIMIKLSKVIIQFVMF